MPYTQENRLIAIDTPLGKDVLLLAGFNGTEGLSRLFSFELDMLSENHNIPFDSIIGKNVTVSVVLADGDKRFFSGIVASFSQGRGGGEEGGDPRFSHYRATMVPWLWLLTRTADSRIFQKLSVPDIVEKIFSERGFSDFQRKLQGSYAEREFCVQYRETDFNFVSRLLEEEGIHYFFEHTDGKHTLILADSPQENKPCPKQDTARYQISLGGWFEEDVITALEKLQEIRPGKYTLNDFNFEMPNTDLKANVPSKQKVGPGEREIYDYPGLYDKKAAGDRLARIRMEEEEAQITTITGSSNCRAFTSGYRFTLSAFYRKDVNDKEYVLTTLQHVANQSFESQTELAYHNHFTCIPFDVPYRPPRVTAKPLVQGTQTAIVVGPSGEEIYTEEHGRVKVQFHWDREGKRDENSSCWIRVAQLWAGPGWGAIFIPRIGQEVIVEFLEGDPDRPIITGRVYHGNNKPPYTLPDEKTKSTIKSDSSQGGGGCNEIRFEDKKGQEQLFFQAEKQQDNRVKEDSLEWIGRDRHLIVTQDQMEQVGGDKHLTVTGDQNEKVNGSVSLTAGMDIQRKAGMKYALDAGTEIHLKAGMNIVIEAGMSITLKAGGGFVVVGPAGVTISGTPVLINSGGAAGSGSGASPATPKPPKEADKAQPGEKVQKPQPAPAAESPQTKAMKHAAQRGSLVVSLEELRAERKERREERREEAKERIEDAKEKISGKKEEKKKEREERREEAKERIKEVMEGIGEWKDKILEIGDEAKKFFEQIALRNFEGRMIDQLKKFSPDRLKNMKEDDSRQLIRHSWERKDWMSTAGIPRSLPETTKVIEKLFDIDARKTHEQRVAGLVDELIPSGPLGKVAAARYAADDGRWGGVQSGREAGLKEVRLSVAAKLLEGTERLDPEVDHAVTQMLKTAPSSIAVPRLANRLNDPDAAVRDTAFKSLQSVASPFTRETHGFDPAAPPEQRLASAQKWKQWWEAQQSTRLQEEVPKMLTDLESENPLRRRAADSALRLLSGRAVGYGAEDSGEVRGEAIKRWHEWWKDFSQQPKNSSTQT